jgi:hypothetical protein
LFFNISENKVWEEIYKCLVFIAFITNGALIFLTLPLFEIVEITSRVWLFFGFQCFLIIYQYFVSYIVPEVPEKVSIQWHRNEFISKKLIEKDLTKPVPKFRANERG